MTREEIEKSMHEAANEIKPLITTLVEALCKAHQKGYLAGVELGAKMAHPQWIPVEEELPKPNIYKEGKTFPLVLVCLNDGCCEDTDAYDTDNKTWCKYGNEVEYWMPLPQPPVKKGGEQ